MLSAQLYTYVFKNCDVLLFKVIILGEAVCITLYSQKSKYSIQNKILSLHSWVVKGWQI